MARRVDFLWIAFDSSNWDLGVTLRARVVKQNNDTHQRAGARCVDFKTAPTAGSVACDCDAISEIGISQ